MADKNDSCFAIILPLDPAFRLFMATAYVVLAIPILFLNLIILVATWKNATLHNPSQILYGNLAITDFSMGIFCLLCSFGNALRYVNAEWIYCQMWPYVGPFIFCLVIMNLYVLALISMDRFLAVKLQFSYRVSVTNKRVMYALTFGWLLCFSTIITMTALSASSTIEMKHLGIIMATFVAFLLCNIALFSSMSFYLLRKLTKETHAINQQFSSQFDTSKYRRTFHTMLIVLCIILSFFIPSLLAVAVTPLFPQKSTAWYLTVITEWISVSNSAVNPLLYIWRMGNLRAAVKKFLGITPRIVPTAQAQSQQPGNIART